MQTGRVFRTAVFMMLACAGSAAAQAPASASVATPAAGGAASAKAPPASVPPANVAAALASAVTPPGDYVIGVEDVLAIVFWRDKDMSSDVVVRPDGRVTLPLINDVLAAGLTPDQLREKVTKEAERFLEAPAATVVVKQINSRRVFITGEVAKPGPYALTSPTTVLQLISLAGGLGQYARKGDIVIMRSEGGVASTFQFDYGAVSKRKKLSQNILLKPGDTVVVP